MTVEPLNPEDPPAIGPYRLLRRLGAGGMGQVFLGRSQTGRMVAVKVVHQELAREPDFRRRFRAEVEAARRVGGMWTAPVLESDTESAVPWVATGYVVGPPLRQVVDSLHGPFAEHSVWALALGLARALEEIHGCGLIHRDLKPSNVMVTLEGPKVIDFGIARAVDASVVTRTGSMVGTPGYMPPEQIRGEELTGAADVFALGAVLAYAATGFDPFSWDGAQMHTILYRVMHEEPQLGPDNWRLTGELRALVVRCLAKDAGARPALAEIGPLAEERAGAEFWLPAQLTARLGQDAAGLLALDGPQTDPAVATPHPPLPYAPSDIASQPTYDPRGFVPSPPPLPALPPAPPEGTPSSAGQSTPPPAGRRPNRYLLGAAAGLLALAVAVPLILINTGGDAGGEDNGGGDGGTDQSAGSVPEPLAEAGVLTVHFSEEAEPVLFLEENGDPAGFEVDLAREIGEQLGVEVEFSLESDDENAAAAAVEAGAGAATHIAMAGFPDESAEREALGVDFVNHFADGWGVLSPDPQQSGALSELCGLRVAVYDDDTWPDRIRRNTADCPEPAEPLTFSVRDEMAAAIEAGEADVAALLYSQAAAWAGEHPGSGLVALLDRGARGPRGIAVPAGQNELREAVRTALGAVMEEGTYEILLTRWNIPAAAVDAPAVNTGD